MIEALNVSIPHTEDNTHEHQMRRSRFASIDEERVTEGSVPVVAHEHQESNDFAQVHVISIISQSDRRDEERGKFLDKPG